MKSYEKLKSAAQTLSSFLKLEMPELAKDEQVSRVMIGISDGKTGVPFP